MRLKTFSAKSMKAAMAEVRDTLGPDAVIVSVEQGSKGHVRVTAAIDRDLPLERPKQAPETQASPAAEEERNSATARSREYDPADLKAAISHHGLSPELAGRIIEAADEFQAATLAEAFSFAFERLMGFASINGESARALMLVGPPGAGKTVSTAKLAAEALVGGRSVRLITADTIKTGGADQLGQYGQMMELDVTSTEDEATLAEAVAYGADSEVTLIDSCGVNPFDMDELEQCVRLIKSAQAEPVLVLPAGLDGLEAADMAEIFAQMGARRFIATRLDTARRYASLISAARAGRLALAGMSRSPYLAEPLETPSSMGLGRLFASLPASKVSQRVRERMN